MLVQPTPHALYINKIAHIKTSVMVFNAFEYEYVNPMFTSFLVEVSTKSGHHFNHPLSHI